LQISVLLSHKSDASVKENREVFADFVGFLETDFVPLVSVHIKCSFCGEIRQQIVIDLCTAIYYP
jgi:hypothetical protein